MEKDYLDTIKQYKVGFYKSEDDEDYIHQVVTSNPQLIPLVGDEVELGKELFVVTLRRFNYGFDTVSHVGIELTKYIEIQIKVRPIAR